MAGISLTALYAKNGWLGQYLEPLGDQGRLCRKCVPLTFRKGGMPKLVKGFVASAHELDFESRDEFRGTYRKLFGASVRAL